MKMKPCVYIRRSVGYFAKLVLLVAVLYALLYITGSARVSAAYFFREMFSSPRGWGLLAALVVLAVAYPRFGYVARGIDADMTADRDLIIRALHAERYVLVGETPGERMSFRAGSGLRRLWMLMDDGVTVRSDGESRIVVDGLRREVVRVEFRMNTYLNNRSDVPQD